MSDRIEPKEATLMGDARTVPSRVKDLTGQTFGRLTVIGFAGTDRPACRALWKCLCECGEATTVAGGSLTRGTTRSCGCMKLQLAAQRSTVHGLRSHPLYPTWMGMVARCTNPSRKEYAHYGGRGITVCAAWLAPETGLAQFIADMGPTHREGLQLDRRDNDGPYSPGNCHWVTRTENGRNKRNNLTIDFSGRSMCLAEWCEVIGLRYDTVRARLNRYGWPVERALIEGVAPERLAALGIAAGGGGSR